MLVSINAREPIRLLCHASVSKWHFLLSLLIFQSETSHFGSEQRAAVFVNNPVNMDTGSLQVI